MSWTNLHAAAQFGRRNIALAMPHKPGCNSGTGSCAFMTVSGSTPSFPQAVTRQIGFLATIAVRIFPIRVDRMIRGAGSPHPLAFYSDWVLSRRISSS